MSILKQIPEYTVKNNQVVTKKPDEVYIDDIFDPLFNIKAKDYLANKYGYGPIGTTLAGYSEMIDNALLGKNDEWGILGPGMGVLSTFGRSMDKADDFILGGLTEGVNAISHTFNPNVIAENPLENIFMKDEDYTGSRLLAAMTNTMSQLAGGTTVDESDFGGLWNIPSTAIELATDPGILGGQLSRRLAPETFKASKMGKLSSSDILKNLGKNNLKTSVGEIGQLLSNYDDLMADVAINMTVPGIKPLLHATVDKIFDLVGAQTYKDYQNVILDSEQARMYDVPSSGGGSTNKYTSNSATNYSTYETMIDNLVKKYDISPETDPELYSKVIDIKDRLAKGREYIDTTEDTLKAQKLNKKRKDIRDLKNAKKTFNTEMTKLEKESMNQLNDLISPNIYTKKGTPKNYKKLTKEEKKLLSERRRLADRLITPVDAYSDAQVLKYDYQTTPEYLQNLSNSGFFSNLTQVNDPNTFNDRIDTLKGIFEDIDGSDYVDASKQLRTPIDLSFYIDKEFNDIDISRFLEDLDNDNLVIPGFEDDPTWITNYIKNKIYKEFPNKNLSTQPVKIYQSQYLDRNTTAANALSKAFNLELKSVLDDINKIYDTDFTTVQDFMRHIRLNDLPQDMFPVKLNFGAPRPQDVDRKFYKTRKRLYKYINSDLTTSNYNAVTDMMSNAPLSITSEPLRKDFLELYKKYKYTKKQDQLLIPAFEILTESTKIPTSKYINNIYELEKWTELVKSKAPEAAYRTNTATGRLVKFMEDFRQNYLNRFEGVTIIDPSLDYSKKMSVNPINSVNYLLRQNPRSFYKPDGTFDIDMFKKFRDTLTNYQVTISGTKDVINFDKYANQLGYSNKEVQQLLDAVHKIQYTDYMYTDSDLQKVIGTKTNPTPIRNLYNYLIDRDALKANKTAKFDLFELRLKAIKDKYGKRMTTNPQVMQYVNMLETSNTLLKKYQAAGADIDFLTQLSKNYKYASDVYAESKNLFKRYPEFKTLDPFTIDPDPFPIKKFLNLEHYENLKKGEIPLEDLPKILGSTNTYREPTIFEVNNSINELLKDPFAGSKEIKKSERNLIKAQKRIEELTNELNSTDFAKRTLNVTSNTTYKYSDFLYNAFPQYSSIASDVSDLENLIKENGTPQDRYLFDVIQDAMAVTTKNKYEDYGVTRHKTFIDIEEKAKALSKDKNLKPDQVLKYLSARDSISGDVVKGTDYLTNLITSNGYNVTVTKANNPLYKKVKAQILANNKILDPEGKFLKYVEATLDNGDIAYGVALNTDYGKELPKDFINFVKKSKNAQLQDITWELAQPDVLNKIPDKAYFDKLDDVFNSSQEFSQYLSKQLGFSNFGESYFKHAMNDNKQGATYLSGIYKKLGIDPDMLQDATSLMTQDLQLRGTFGTLPYNRSLRGNIYRFNSRAPVFSTDVDTIIRSTYTKGMLDNSNFQTYLDLFENGNFKINTYAKTPDDLKRILFAKDGMGNYTGNLSNMSLVAAKTNEAGKLIGFTQFDKFSDKGLQQALANPNTILVPTETVAHLQQLCKKDVRMSNKWYAFFNKHFVLPWKFGILTNPGFLVGNYSDAYFKQALTMSRKYGTTFTEELQNVLDCNRYVNILNNRFYDIYTEYVKSMEHINPAFIPPSSVLNSTSSRRAFVEFLNDNKVLSPKEEDIARLFLYMNNAQTTTMFKDVASEAEKMSYKSAFNAPTTKLERILMGTKGSADEHIGLFTNNPLSDKVLDTSENIENTFRSGMILNDLRHKGYTSKDMMDLLDLNAVLEKEVKQKLDVDLTNAINTMNSANFSYDATGPLIDTMTYVQTFPTFYLKNIAYWLQVMVENPQIIDNVISVQQGLWQNEDTSKDEFKAEAKGRGAIPISTGQNGQLLSNFFKGIYKPSPLNSMFGAFSSLNNPIEDFTQRLKPPLKLTTYPLQKAEDIKYRPYSTNPYEKNITRNDPRFNPLEYAIHSYNPYERTINTYSRTPAKVLAGNAQLSDFLPSIFQPNFSKKSNNKKNKSRN